MIRLAQGPVGGTVYHRPPYFKGKKLGLIGRTENIKYAPWHDPSWILVSHTSARPLCKREPDWYFDLHRPECFRTEGKQWNTKFYTWLQRLQVPIFMQEEWPEIPMAVRYPIERILQEFRAYFTNHCSYMIALAMTEGVETVGLFGCQYGADSEYSTQRGSLEYWLGRFEQAGGQVILPVKHNTVLGFPSKLYGYESHDDKGNLIDEYKPRKVTMEKATKSGIVPTDLKVVQMSVAEGRIPLATPPNGDAIAWERSGHTLHC
jgi:hypothetical protein